MLDWYHFYLNHPGGSRLAKITREIFYWECLVMQAKLLAKTCNICQYFKKRKTLYLHLPPKNIAELKPWDLLHVDLIGIYKNSIRQQKSGVTIIRKNASLTCITMIDPATGWSEIFETLTFDLDEVTAGNDEYIEK